MTTKKKPRTSRGMRWAMADAGPQRVRARVKGHTQSLESRHQTGERPSLEAEFEDYVRMLERHPEGNPHALLAELHHAVLSERAKGVPDLEAAWNHLLDCWSVETATEGESDRLEVASLPTRCLRSLMEAIRVKRREVRADLEWIAAAEMVLAHEGEG